MKTTSKTFAALLGLATAVALAVPASAMDANSFERGPMTKKVAAQSVSVSTSVSSSGSVIASAGSNRDLIEQGVGVNSVSRKALGR